MNNAAHADRPVLGVMLMLGFCAMAPLGDASAKALGATMALGQLLLIRFAIQAALLTPLIAVTGGTFRMTPRVLRLTLIRTVIHVVAIGMMFTALQYLPLADAIAIAFVMPFIMLLLGRFFLNEEVGPRRIAACAVGFVGTLMVVQPSFAAVGAPALLPLGVAILFALFMLVTRQMAKDVDPITLQAVSGVAATIGLGAAALIFADWSFFAMKAPTGFEWTLLAAIGVLGTVAHLLMTWSLRFAPSATLAPMQYLEIPFATIVGWAAFGDLPNGLAAIGIAVTVGAGLYIIWRERATARASAAAPPAA
ncbi:MAG: DMT family transporter [Pseudomonadota bacterium]